jgi:Zn-dependent peptidase ImmA (M78 family)
LKTTYTQAENTAKQYQTRNPYELLDAIGAHTRFSYVYEPNGLKGYSTILNDQMFVVINGHLNEHDRKIVAGHEAAHLILHKAEILSSTAKAMMDFDLFSNTGKLEHQANSFLADFLISDEDLIEASCGDSCDENADYFTTAKALQIPPPLLAYKLYSMIQRGHKINGTVDLKSDFLGKVDIW